MLSVKYCEIIVSDSEAVTEESIFSFLHFHQWLLWGYHIVSQNQHRDSIRFKIISHDDLLKKDLDTRVTVNEGGRDKVLTDQHQEDDKRCKKRS